METIFIKNKQRYYDAISNIKPDNNVLKEKNVQKKLHHKLGGRIEVETEFGFVDLLTTKYIIEIKHYDNWKYAIGQLAAYSHEYPNKKKVMYLFDVPENNKIDRIRKVCSNYDINVRICDE